MTKSRTPSEVTAAYVSFLSHQLTDECAAALEGSNRYKRPAVRQAFQAGWYAWRIKRSIGEGFTAPQLSTLTRRAFLRGMDAREQYETNHQSVRTR